MLRDAIVAIDSGNAESKQQNEAEATYSRMLGKDDGKIDWNRSAEELDAVIRACTSWPGAFTTVNGTVLKILEASVYAECGATGATGSGATREHPACPGTVIGMDKAQGILFQTGKGLLVARVLQWQAKKALPFKDFLNGSRNFIGSVCGS